LAKSHLRCSANQGISIRNPAYPLDIVDKLEEATMHKVEAWMAKRVGKTNNCTLEKAAVRREW
jgi:tyrosinase